MHRHWFAWCLLSLSLVAATQGASPTQTVTFSMRKLAFSTNQFGIDLYRALDSSHDDGGQHRNVALCPFCVGTSLAMLYLGAEGPSEMALRQALYLWGLQPQDIHVAYRDLIAHLGLNLEEHEGRRDEDDEGNVLRIANQIYVQRHFSVHYPFQYMLNRFYNTSVTPVDFVLNAEQSTRYINSYFSRQTAGKATQILSRVPSPSANLLLLSALYFRGTLDMDMARTDEARASTFPLMQARKARVRYGSHEYLNCTAVEVPFKGGLISLLALLPRDAAGMRLLETRLSAQRLADILNVMEVDTVDFQMPRISVGQTQGHNLTRALYNLGLVDLFTPGRANLFGLSPFGWLHLTNVTHATHVEVREGAKEVPISDAPPAPLKVVLDRPFLWFVMDNVAGLAIAMGKMATPESAPESDLKISTS